MLSPTCSIRRFLYKSATLSKAKCSWSLESQASFLARALWPRTRRCFKHRIGLGGHQTVPVCLGVHGRRWKGPDLALLTDCNHQFCSHVEYYQGKMSLFAKHLVSKGVGDFLSVKRFINVPLDRLSNHICPNLIANDVVHGFKLQGINPP